MQRLILSFNNREEVYEHPVPIQDWDLASSVNTHTFTTITEEEVVAIGGKKLRTMSIDSFFPSKPYPFLFGDKNAVQDKWKIVEMIRKWETSRRPIRVIIAETPVNLAMVIEDFKHGRADHDGSGDVAFSLSLLEYSFLNTPRSKRKEKKKEDKDKLKERPDEKSGETKTHKVKKGDTMWDMAEKYLGDGKRWKEIAKLNNMKSGWDLRVGKDIKIPPKEKDQTIIRLNTPAMIKPKMETSLSDQQVLDIIRKAKGDQK